MQEKLHISANRNKVTFLKLKQKKSPSHSKTTKTVVENGYYRQINVCDR